MTNNCSKYTKTALECIFLVKENPGISAKQIIDNHPRDEKQRRVYGALNILEGAEVFNRGSNKK